MTGKEKSRGSPVSLSLLDFSPLESIGLFGEKGGRTAGGSEQGMAVETGMRGDKQVGHATA